MNPQGRQIFLPLFGRRNINCGCSSSKCSLKPGVGKMKILFRVLENQSTWSILLSLPFPPPSPATSSWGGRTSHQHQGESKTSLAVPTTFGHCWEGSGFCSFLSLHYALQGRYIQNNIEFGFQFGALLDSLSIFRRWRTASSEESGLGPAMKLWLTSAVQVQTVVWAGFGQPDASVGRQNSSTCAGHGERTVLSGSLWWDSLPVDYKIDLK